MNFHDYKVQEGRQWQLCSRMNFYFYWNGMEIKLLYANIIYSFDIKKAMNWVIGNETSGIVYFIRKRNLYIIVLKTFWHTLLDL